ncbi:hypothetical protein DLAC_08499 [Tieghemostelium lacteum]|uniref:Uncharacterized protein n=1 Tax=Tieghemostelium lacteum TaxID=361077 RepID=A0A151Z7I8_TIELA|nr:hypothetical protein DLAC_08499 [Tieghemostelium lacteum]|eukprot:KYQ89929.1 hypothetical protein DLAC_08499 [Tieghemostelium lacteum]
MNGRRHKRSPFEPERIVKYKKILYPENPLRRLSTHVVKITFFTESYLGERLVIPWAQVQDIRINNGCSIQVIEDIEDNILRTNDIGILTLMIVVDWSKYDKSINGDINVFLSICPYGQLVIVGRNFDEVEDIRLKVGDPVRYNLQFSLDINRATKNYHIDYIFGGMGVDLTPKTGNGQVYIHNGIIIESNLIFVYALLMNVAFTLGDGGYIVSRILVEVYEDGNPKYHGAHYIDGDNTIQCSYKSSWEPLTLVHEYGHFVQEILYAEKSISIPITGDDHEPCDSVESTSNVAWSEGYADSFSIIMGKVMKMKYATDNKVSQPWDEGQQISGRYSSLFYDYYACDTSVFERDEDGNPKQTYIERSLDNDEGRVTAMLYDLYDSNDDSLIKKPSDEIMNKIKEKYPKILPAWFGVSTGSDSNSGNELTYIEILVDAIRESNQASLQCYIYSLLNSPNLKSEKKEYVKDIIIYNYGSTFLDQNKLALCASDNQDD